MAARNERVQVQIRAMPRDVRRWKRAAQKLGDRLGMPITQTAWIVRALNAAAVRETNEPTG